MGENKIDRFIECVTPKTKRTLLQEVIEKVSVYGVLRLFPKSKRFLINLFYRIV
jgi:hypothetical protein